jgi:diguanylate cyclase (GGDEF)-like protein/PAS domain S-box-containing protein
MEPYRDDGRPLATEGVPRARHEEHAARRDDIADRVFQTSVDGILAFDRHLAITAWNPSMEALFGLTGSEVVGRSIFAVLPCFLANGEAQLYRATLDGDAPVSRARPFAVEKTGCAGLVDCHYSPLRDEDGTTSGGMVMFRDRTRSSEVALALRDAREQFTELFEHAPIGMALIEIDAERIGTFLRVNEALCRITGRAAPDLTDATVIDLTDPADAGAEIALVRRLLAGDLPRYQIEKGLRRAGASPAWVTAGVSLLRSADGISRHAIMQVEDITALRESRRRLELLSNPGPAPKVCDRAVFDAALRRQIADAARHDHPGALLVLHLDGLGEIEDALGREASDEAITLVGELLRARMRETDVVAALCRDEFGVVLRLADARTANAIASELVRQISATVVVGRGPERIAMTATAGVAAIDPQRKAGHDLLAEARSARRAARIRRGGDVAPDGAASATGAV